MKTTVLLMIILVKQSYTVTPSSCKHNETIEFISTDQKYQLKLCLSNSACFELKDNIMFCKQSSTATPQNASDCLEVFDFSYSQDATTTQYSSAPVSSSTTSITTTTKAQNDTPSTINIDSRQNILIALLVIFAVLLAIVSTGWVCTCWAMKKRRQEMNINTTHIRYSEIQVTNGNNIMSLRHNQAYGTQPEKETNNSNNDEEYEVIPPLMHEKTRLNTDDDRKNVSHVQTSQSTTQQASPGQPKEEVEHTHEQLEQTITESSEQKDQTGNVNVYHTFESKAEDNDDDKAAPYEVPVPTPMNQE